MPAALAVDYSEIRRAVETGTVTLQEAAERFDVPFRTIQKRSYREDWLIPSRIVAKAKEIEEKRLSQRVSNTPKALDVAAQSLVERQEEHREIVHRMMRKALKNAEKAPPSIENMTDLEKAVKIHRLTLDMSTGEAGAVQVNLWSGGASVSQGLTERVIDVENVTSETEEWV
jgi:formiminotetrahydrofolate cyclodeaminase